MSHSWLQTIPVLEEFEQVADPSRYAPVPEDWIVGVSDVVDSTAAIKAGHYKSVNLAGAGTISAVINALDGNVPLFVFGGDGARFVVPPEHAAVASDALGRVSGWARRDLDLDLRVGMMSVTEVRAAGHDVRAAFWRASEHVRYAMFIGGGLEWADAQLKKGVIDVQAAGADKEPDLTGLSCQWGLVRPKKDKILSLIVKRAAGASQADFSNVVNAVVATLEKEDTPNPVPADGPKARWSFDAMGLQSRIAQKSRSKWQRRLMVLTTTSLAWIIFRSGLRVGRFDPGRYRQEIATNTDFRKFDDALMMTVDCSHETLAELRDILEKADAAHMVRYGLHVQDEALMTCVVPSVMTSDHMHFIDGAGGGYASAAQQLRP